MKILNLFSVILLSFLLAACGTIKQVEKQEVTKTVLVEPPNELLKDCEVIEPFSKKLYLQSSQDKREELFTKLVIDQYGSIKKCNISKEELRKWFEDQRIIFNK